MIRRLWTATAQNEKGKQIQISEVYPGIPSREELAGRLVIEAQKEWALVQSGRRGAGREERLGELGFRITSITDADPEG
ncbi:MAG: hypothetical protein V4679_14750 [Pseudomonadota bacterium]